MRPVRRISEARSVKRGRLDGKRLNSSLGRVSGPGALPPASSCTALLISTCRRGIGGASLGPDVEGETFSGASRVWASLFLAPSRLIGGVISSVL